MTTREIPGYVVRAEFDRPVGVHQSCAQVGRGDGLSAFDLLHESDGLALGPAAIVAVGFGEKGAMSAMLGFEIGDAWILPEAFRVYPAERG